MRIEIMETLLDHVFITVKYLDRSIAFYERALKPLGIVHALDYDPRYYAANVFDPDGYSLEAVYKSWQHRQS